MKEVSWSSLRYDYVTIIKNFVESYPYDPFEILVIESIANALDAKCSKISIKLEQKGGDLVFTIIDNGEGMTKEEFEENYHALAISSKTRGEGIGFAGIGAKLYLIFLQPSKTIITETSKNGHRLASRLALIEEEPKWMYIEPSSLSHDGTLYQVPINPEHSMGVNETVLIEIIQRHFNSVLLGFSTNQCEIEVNGKKVPPWHPDLLKEYSFSFLIAGKTCTGIFWYARGKIKRLPGIEISMHGKTIMNDWFGLDYNIRSQVREKITGLIIADPLAALLNTSKTAVRPSANPPLWSTFRKTVFKHFKDWLQSIDALEQRRTKTARAELLALQSEVQKILATSLQTPNLMKYNPFMSLRRARVVVKSEDGKLPITESDGRQIVKDAKGGKEGGIGIDAIGPEPGKSSVTSEKGRKKGNELERRTRTGIRINFVDEPSNPKETWITPEALVINEGHPVFVKSRLLGYSSELLNMLRCVYMELIQGRPPDSVAEAMDDLRQFFYEWSKVPL